MTDEGATQLRVATFRSFASNPYLRLFEDALAQRGVLQAPVPPTLSAKWARNAHHEVEAVHLHWLEALFRRDGIRGLRRPLSALAGRSVERALRALAESPVRVVWTLHNLRPHEDHLPRTFDRVRRSATEAADVILCHSHAAAQRAREDLQRPNGIWPVPHGHYIGAYPPARRSREEVRRDLGIPPGAFVHLMFGQLRAYKQAPDAIHAFREANDPDAWLLVAGAALQPEVREATRTAADGHPRVVLRLDSVPDEQVAELHEAADAAVLNHRDLFSSGVLMLELSFGLPVVAPAAGPVLEIGAPAAREPFAPGELARALLAVREGDQRTRRRAALEAAHACGWDLLADAATRAYRGEDRG